MNGEKEGKKRRLIAPIRNPVNHRKLISVSTNLPYTQWHHLHLVYPPALRNHSTWHKRSILDLTHSLNFHQNLVRIAFSSPSRDSANSLSVSIDLEKQYAKAKQSGKGKGKLEGISVGVKDMFATSGDGSRTTCASRMLRGESGNGAEGV